MGIDYLIFLFNQYPLFYNPIFIGLLSTGIIFIIAGFILFKNPPKQVNYFYGYRSKSSMKNQERWDFAQIYSAKVMILLGFILILISFFGLIYLPIIGVALTVTFLIIISSAISLILIVERKIKQKFN